MLRVIQGAAIGNHEVTEKKVIEDSIKKTIQITTVTKHPPSKKSGKNWLLFLGEFQSQILLKISDFSESDFVISI